MDEHIIVMMIENVTATKKAQNHIQGTSIQCHSTWQYLASGTTATILGVILKWEI